jgi:hypothetical protein
MTDAVVREAVTTFFQECVQTATPPLEGQILGLAQVLKEFPWILLQDQFDMQMAGGFGAVGIVHLVNRAEDRLTVGATNPNAAIPTMPTGTKMVKHNIGFVIVYQYVVPSNLQGQWQDIWVDPLDGIVDGITAKIRSDPSFGTGPNGTGNTTTIWQGGQDQNDLRITRDMAQNNGGLITVWNAIEFSLDEIVTG